MERERGCERKINRERIRKKNDIYERLGQLVII